MDHIVLDVEIQKTIDETPGGWNSTDMLGVSVAVVYEFLSNRFRVFGPPDVGILKERLLAADRISGYNIWNFDFPVIWGVAKNNWPDLVVAPKLLPKTNDILRRIWQSLGLDPDKFHPSTHNGWKLDDVASSTLGVGKIANGVIAPVWFQQGNWWNLTNYCCDDVAIERDLADFVDRYGFVVNRGRVLKVNYDNRNGKLLDRP